MDKPYKKIHYVYKERGEDYFWQDAAGNKLRFSGNPKLIVKALVETHGLEKGKDIFDGFIKGVKEIERVLKGGSTFVLYKQTKDANKFKGSTKTSTE